MTIGWLNAKSRSGKRPYVFSDSPGRPRPHMNYVSMAKYLYFKALRKGHLMVAGSPKGRNLTTWNEKLNFRWSRKGVA